MRTGSEPSAEAALAELAREAARMVATPREVTLPYVERDDVLGRLARALEVLQVVAVERAVLATMLAEAPIGIALVGPDGRYRSANRALAAMYGYPTPESMLGRPAPDDVGLAAQELTAIERQHVGRDGSVTWHETVVAPVRGPAGGRGSMALLVRDVTAHVLERRRAVAIQRALLPKAAPRIAGYDLSGACRQAQNLSCDFFDWVARPGGHLDLTVADVMGKGMGAALVMAGLRTGLRAAPAESGPADRVRTALDAMSRQSESGALPVSLFQARVDTANGAVRYVDAGHGWWAVRRASGRLDRPSRPSTPPLLALPETNLAESQLALEPGDALVIYTDSLAAPPGEPSLLDDLERRLAAAGGAGEIVERVLELASPSLVDDVVVLALRRQPLAGATPQGDDRHVVVDARRHAAQEPADQ